MSNKQFWCLREGQAGGGSEPTHINSDCVVKTHYDQHVMVGKHEDGSYYATEENHAFVFATQRLTLVLNTGHEVTAWGYDADAIELAIEEQRRHPEA